jgi:hypothetical protein
MGSESERIEQPSDVGGGGQMSGQMPSDEIRPEEVGAMPHPGPTLRPTGDDVDDDRARGSRRDPLLPEDRTNGYRDRWEQIQARFVDDPRNSVEQADTLVMEVVQELQTSFGSERRSLEAQWQRGDDVQTEDLRVAFQRYRSFFDRLLAA